MGGGGDGCDFGYGAGGGGARGGQDRLGFVGHGDGGAVLAGVFGAAVAVGWIGAGGDAAGVAGGERGDAVSGDFAGGESSEARAGGIGAEDGRGGDCIRCGGRGFEGISGDTRGGDPLGSGGAVLAGFEFYGVVSHWMDERQDAGEEIYPGVYGLVCVARVCGVGGGAECGDVDQCEQPGEFGAAAGGGAVACDGGQMRSSDPY